MGYCRIFSCCFRNAWSMVFMIWLLPIIYLLIVASHASVDCYLIKVRHKTINHKFEAAIYILICIILGAVALITGFGWELLPLILFPIITRAAFFDPLLNWFRGLHWLYEGSGGNSYWDRLERQIGLPVALYRIIYLLVYGAWLFYYFLIF